jgi:hypothetical protein
MTIPFMQYIFIGRHRSAFYNLNFPQSTNAESFCSAPSPFYEQRQFAPFPFDSSLLEQKKNPHPNI